jgi:hypothetical protein
LVKHAKFVQQNEVRKNGLQILRDVYSTVLKSDDKDLWKQAIESTHRHIAHLERKVGEAAAHDDECADAMVINLWAWNSARRQLCARFGRKFIHISSPSSHGETAEKSF